MGEIKIIDPVTKQVLFDSDHVTPDMENPKHDHMASGDGWSISTREQLERQLKQTSVTCLRCDSLVLTMDDNTWTCQSCKHTFPYKGMDRGAYKY